MSEEVKDKEVKTEKKIEDKQKIEKKTWDEWTRNGILKWVYENYSKYTDKSVVLDEIFPNKKLYRRRG